MAFNYNLIASPQKTEKKIEFAENRISSLNLIKLWTSFEKFKGDCTLQNMARIWVFSQTPKSMQSFFTEHRSHHRTKSKACNCD